MQQEDPKAYATLQQHFADVAGSNLDPTVLAAELFAAKIIGKARIVEASNPVFPAPNVKLQNILTDVMSSGKPGAFQDFVRIILKTEQCYWLGEKLINTYKAHGGEWVEAPTTYQQQSRVSQNGSGAISYTGSVPPAPELKDLMHLRVSDWIRLGLALELDYYDLEIIEKDNQGDRKKQALKMFQHWLNSKPNASYEQLIKALYEVGEETVASSLCLKYGIRFMPSAASTGPRSQPTMAGGYTQPAPYQTQPTQPGSIPQSYQQYPQNPSHLSTGPTHQPVYPHHGHPPAQGQYPPQQSYYYGQPAPSTQIPPAGSSHHAWVPTQQHAGAPMQGPSHQGANQWCSDPSSVIRRGDTPVLTKLLKFPSRYGKINIPERIGTNYRTFGTFLLKDDTGAIVSGIIRAKMHAADEINEAILERWIDGKGQGPFTWATLVKCLRDTELNTLANEIEEVLQ